MERIVTHRLYGFAEHFNLIDKEQEGFRRFRGTVDALLRLTQDIIDGFNKKESTAALFIDIEKAYDSIWHEGLLYKLKELGIRGRVWEWIKSFLNDRKAVINLAGKRAQEFCIKIGLPQGSVLSPLLFLLFMLVERKWSLLMMGLLVYGRVEKIGDICLRNWRRTLVMYVKMQEDGG